LGKGQNDRGEWDDANRGGWTGEPVAFRSGTGNTDPIAKFREGLGQIHAPQDKSKGKVLKKRLAR